MNGDGNTSVDLNLGKGGTGDMLGSNEGDEKLTRQRLEKQKGAPRLMS